MTFSLWKDDFLSMGVWEEIGRGEGKSGSGTGRGTGVGGKKDEFTAVGSFPSSLSSSTHALLFFSIQTNMRFISIFPLQWLRNYVNIAVL